MKRIFFSIITIFTACQVIAQDFPINSNGLPANWRTIGTAKLNTEIGRTDNYSLQIEEENSMVITDNLTNVNLLQFFLRSPQNTDDFDLIIDHSTDEGKTWFEHTTIALKLDPTKSALDNPNHFQALSISWNKPGKVRFQFRIAKRLPSSILLLDDFHVVPLTDDQTTQFVTNSRLNAKIEEIKKDIEQQVAYTNFNQARLRFQEAAENTKKNIHLLANIMDKASGIYLISGISEKIATRNQMVNPWNYDKFKDFVSKIESRLPEVKRNNLSDILNIIKTPLQLADKVLLNGRLSAFSMSIKSLIGDAFTKTNLKEEIGLSNKEIDREIKSGVALYGSVKIFLDILLKENDKANLLNEVISEVTKESKLLMKNSEEHLVKYLEFVEISNPEQEIMALKTNKVSTIQRIDQAVDRFYDTQLGSSRSFNSGKLNPSQNTVLSRTIILSNEAEDLRTRYPDLTTQMTNLLDNLKNDAQAPNPFQNKNTEGKVVDLIDASTTAKWNEFKASLSNDLDNIITTFRTSYVQYNLYD